MMASTSVALLLLAAVAAVLPHASALHGWSNYHWARTGPTLQLPWLNATTGAWAASLTAVAADWATPTLQPTIISPSSVGYKINATKCNIFWGYVSVCNSNYGATGWAGLGSISVTSDGHIVAGSAKMNEQYLGTSINNWWRYTLCQELGHTLGLGHVNTNSYDANTGSCMDYTSYPAGCPTCVPAQVSNMRPNQHDYDVLNAASAHVDPVGGRKLLGVDARTWTGATDPSQGRAARPSNGAEIDTSTVTDDPTTWGEIVESGERHKTYKRKVNNSLFVLTTALLAVDINLGN